MTLKYIVAAMRQDHAVPFCEDCGEPILHSLTMLGSSAFHRDCLKAVQEEMDSLDWVNLGVMNGWDSDPKEYARCVQLGHQHAPMRYYEPHEHWRRFECPLCRIRFSVDSS